MIYFSGAKINLGLKILSKREDGYHNIESVFYPIPLNDVIEIIPSEEFEFTYTGIDKIEGLNLIEKAYLLLKEKYKILNCKIHLHKNIPIGAGLAGGSGNGSVTLLALNKQFNLNLSNQELEKLALQLGSDCPFFIENKPKLVTGRGEHLTKINLDLKGYYLLVVNPGIHISTQEAYQNLVIGKESQISVKEIESKPVEEWQTFLENDFEEYAFNKYPEIKVIKKTLITHGALYASMTGTGSTVYGIFKELDKEISFSNHFYVKWIEL